MTKEQEKAIKVLEQYKHECIEEYKVELDDKKYTDEQHASYLHQQIEAVHIVLSMLKEKDKEIEHWKNGFERELEDNRKNTCELLKQDLIIREKDKQIDYMANFINDNTPYTKATKELENEYGTRTVDFTVKYFERKSKE